MREVLYTKYNSKRKPIYQLSTSIMQDGETRFAIKKAIQPRAEQHLNNLVENRKKLESLYENIKIVDCQKQGEEIVFPFVEGKHLLEEIDLANGKVDDIVEQIKAGFEKISSYKENMLCSFEMTDGFAEVFPGCEPKETEQAIKIANIDSLFGNFVELENGKLCCIDYEWVFDFPVPLNYITFRNLHYFYIDNELYLKKKVERKGFYEKFGYSEEEIELYTKMESEFQQYVHGENWEYIYLQRYEKHTTNLVELEEKMQQLRDDARRWEELANHQQAHIEKMRRAIKNPFYGLYWLCKKAVKKLLKKGN